MNYIEKVLIGMTVGVIIVAVVFVVFVECSGSELLLPEVDLSHNGRINEK